MLGNMFNVRPMGSVMGCVSHNKEMSTLEMTRDEE